MSRSENDTWLNLRWRSWRYCTGTRTFFLYISLYKRVGKLELRLSKKGSRCNYTSAFAFYPEHDCDSKACHELLFDKLNQFKFHTKLLACYAGTARNIPPTNKCRCDGTRALHGNAAPSFTALRNHVPFSRPSIPSHGILRNPQHSKTFSSSTKRNDLQAELRINILFLMKTVFLVLQYIIIIFLFKFGLRRQVEDDARLLEQVPLASVRPVFCVAVKRRWNENRILLSYAIIHSTLTYRRSSCSQPSATQWKFS
jgi:hypothetical protein